MLQRAKQTTLSSDMGRFGPNGAEECSHGCSAARIHAGEAKPVVSDPPFSACPGRAKESLPSRHAVHQ